MSTCEEVLRGADAATLADIVRYGDLSLAQAFVLEAAATDGAQFGIYRSTSQFGPQAELIIELPAAARKAHLLTLAREFRLIRTFTYAVPGGRTAEAHIIRLPRRAEGER